MKCDLQPQGHGLRQHHLDVFTTLSEIPKDTHLWVASGEAMNLSILSDGSFIFMPLSLQMMSLSLFRLRQDYHLYGQCVLFQAKLLMHEMHCLSL